MHGKPNDELDWEHDTPDKAHYANIKVHPTLRQSSVSVDARLPAKRPIVHFRFSEMRKDLPRSNVIVKPPKHLSTANSLNRNKIQWGNTAPVGMQYQLTCSVIVYAPKLKWELSWFSFEKEKMNIQT